MWSFENPNGPILSSIFPKMGNPAEKLATNWCAIRDWPFAINFRNLNRGLR